MRKTKINPEDIGLRIDQYSFGRGYWDHDGVVVKRTERRFDTDEEFWVVAWSDSLAVKDARKLPFIYRPKQSKKTHFATLEEALEVVQKLIKNGWIVNGRFNIERWRKEIE